MRILVLLIAAATVVSAPGTTVWGTTRTPRVSARQHRQSQRISQGVNRGELTRSETKELIKGQKETSRMKKNAKADGVVTMEERKEIRQKQNEESNKIYEEKHDSEKR